MIKKQSGNIFSIILLLFFLFCLAGAVYLLGNKTILKPKASAVVPNVDAKNVVLILTDDLNEDNLNQMLSAGKLPNIQKYLIDQGTRFSNSFAVESVCCPSRASFITGKYPHNTGVFNLVGSEGGMKGFLAKGNYNNNLATWLSEAGYYTGHIGKTVGINGANVPNTAWPGWQYWRKIDSYDSRPGMFKVMADNNPNWIWPDVYQAKYISDSAIDFIDNFQKNFSDRKFYLEVTPLMPHISIPLWNNGEILKGDSKKVVAFNEFNVSGQIKLRRQLVKDDGNGDYDFYGSDSSDGKSFGDWYYVGKGSQLLNNTANLPIKSFSAFVHPDTGSIRQHIVRGNTWTDSIIYSRDLQTNGTWTQWGSPMKLSDLIPNPKNLPLISFKSGSLPNKNIMQQVLLGDDRLGYELFTRARIDGKFTQWKKEEDLWDNGNGGGKIASTSFADIGNGNLERIYVRWNMAGNNYYLYKQTIRNFYTTQNSTVLGTSTPTNEPTVYADEAAQMTDPTVGSRFSGLPYPQISYRGRVYSDGNWTNPQAYQSYPIALYGGKMPAGSLRAGGDPDGFTPVSPEFDLPSVSKGSFNKPNCSQVPPFNCSKLDNGTPIWPDLNQIVIGNKTQLDYLRRTNLDRLESLLSLDVMVGQIMMKLENSGLLDKTVVVFASDNGYMLGEHRLSNKTLPYEEAIRIPLIIRYPESNATKAKENKNTVLNIDFAPTVLDYAKLDWTDSKYSVDGRSLKPFSSSTVSVEPNWRNMFLTEQHYARDYVSDPEWFFAWYIPDFYGIRTGEEQTDLSKKNIMFSEYTADPRNLSAPTFYELYDLKKDPTQMNNVSSSSEYVNIKNSLLPLIDQFRSCSGQKCRDIDH